VTPAGLGSGEAGKIESSLMILVAMFMGRFLVMGGGWVDDATATISAEGLGRAPEGTRDRRSERTARTDVGGQYTRLACLWHKAPAFTTASSGRSGRLTRSRGTGTEKL
jgi:hypothetical protein